MRVAAVGAGAWGKNIVRTLHGLGALSAVVEADEALRQDVAASYPDTKVVGALGVVLEDVDAVAIATPAPTHAEIALQALRAGKHVFVEKPITLTVAEAEQLVSEADRVEKTLMVGHLLLYQPAVEWLRAAIQNQVVGRTLMLHQERLNLGRARSVENVLWSLGVHDIAVALFLMGDRPTSVRSVGAKMLPATGVEDDVRLSMEFPNGAVGHLHNSWLWPERRRRTIVIGDKGMLVYDESDQTVTLHRKRIDGDLRNVDEGAEVVFQGDGEPLKLELQHFLDCAKTGDRPRSDGRSAVEVVRVLEEATKQ